MSKELKAGDVVKVLVDPLSHGENMVSLLVEVEIEQCDTVRVEALDSELVIDVAIARTVSQQATEYGNHLVLKEDDGTWGDLVGNLESWIRVDGGSWQYTCWQIDVDIIEETV